jgi:hypothetical protein
MEIDNQSRAKVTFKMQRKEERKQRELWNQSRAKNRDQSGKERTIKVKSK